MADDIYKGKVLGLGIVHWLIVGAVVLLHSDLFILIELDQQRDGSSHKDSYQKELVDIT